MNILTEYRRWQEAARRRRHRALNDATANLRRLGAKRHRYGELEPVEQKRRREQEQRAQRHPDTLSLFDKPKQRHRR